MWFLSFSHCSSLSPVLVPQSFLVVPPFSLIVVPSSFLMIPALSRFPGLFSYSLSPHVVFLMISLYPLHLWSPVFYHGSSLSPLLFPGIFSWYSYLMCLMSLLISCQEIQNDAKQIIGAQDEIIHEKTWHSPFKFHLSFSWFFPSLSSYPPPPSLGSPVFPHCIFYLSPLVVPIPSPSCCSSLSPLGMFPILFKGAQVWDFSSLWF